MKKLICVLIAIDIISLIIGFFVLLSASFIYSILLTALGILNIVPLIAILSNLESCEQNTADISYLYSKLKKLENNTEIPTYPIAVKHGDTPNKSWKCLKCGTVNKAEASACINCKAEYSYLNTTYDSEPKRKSRFVKF